MNFVMIFMLCFHIQIHVSKCANDKLRRYLHEKSVMVEENLLANGTMEKELIESVEYEISNNRLYNNTNAHTFTVFNRTYVLVNGQVHYLSLANNSFEFSTFRFEDDVDGGAGGDVVALRTIEYDNVGFVLAILKDGHPRIYGIADDVHFFLQSIDSSNASDGRFFANANNLYLIMANNELDRISQTIIYKFTGSYFDEIRTILTRGVTELITFASNASQIIIIFQNPPNFAMSSEVFDFKSDTLRKIQKIETNNPRHAVTYIYEQNRYVVVFNNNNIHTMYIWNGFELAKLSSIIINATFHDVIVSNNERPLIVALHKREIRFYAPRNSTIKFIKSENYTSGDGKILSLHTLESGNNSIFIISKIVDANNINIYIFSVSVKLVEKDRDEQKRDEILFCIRNLEKNIYKHRNELKIFANTTSTSVPKINVERRESASDEEMLREIRQLLHKLSTRLHKAKASLKDADETGHVMTVNGSVVFRKSVEARRLVAKNLLIKRLNGLDWHNTTGRWLSFGKEQAISGPVTVAQITANSVRAGGAFFDNILEHGGRISGSVKANTAIATNIYAGAINNISVSDFYMKSAEKPVAGLKRIKNLTAKTANLLHLRMGNSELVSYQFGPNLTVDHLWADIIDGLGWDNFKKSVFRIGVSPNITGNIRFAELKVRNATLFSLGGREIGDIFTVNGNQTVKSSIQFGQIYARNLDAQRINGYDFRNDVATLGRSAVKGPVKFDKVYIENDLEIIGEVNKSSLIENRIIGTNESDLLQIYNGTVKIKGNLLVNNLRLKQDTDFTLNGHNFNNTLDQYWTKNTMQVIPRHFEALNGINCPHIQVNRINQVNINDFMLNNLDDKPFTRYYFENISVFGDIVLDQFEHHSPDLHKIDGQSVKMNGSFTINGHKIFKGNFKVDELTTKQLNLVDHSATTTTGKFRTDTDGGKFIENLVIEGDLAVDTCVLKVINDIDVGGLEKDAFYTSRSGDVRNGEISIRKVSVANMRTSKINGRPVDEYFAKLNDLYRMDTIGSVIINGDARIKSITNLSAINGRHNFDRINKDVYYKNGTIYGDVKFTGKLGVNNLHVVTINGVNFLKLSKRLLYKGFGQRVKAAYTFKNVKTGNLRTPAVNRVPLYQLINVSNSSNQIVDLPNGLRIINANVAQLAGRKSLCDLVEASKRIRQPTWAVWGGVEIRHNATFWDVESSLNRIFTKTVSRNSDNVIDARVDFLSHTYSRNVVAEKLINTINLTEIVNDAVVVGSPEQVQTISGWKKFTEMSCGAATVQHDTRVDAINKIDVLRVNRSIAGWGGAIRGRKVFARGLQTSAFSADFAPSLDFGTLVDKSAPTAPIEAVFSALKTVERLNIGHVNGVRFADMVGRRLLRRAAQPQTLAGNLFFSRISLQGDTDVAVINDLPVDGIVFDKAEQIVNGPKKIVGDLVIVGKLNVDYINGWPISETYEQAIIAGEAAVVNGITTILRAAVCDGNITTDTINGFPMQNMVETINKEAPTGEIYDIYRMSKKMQRMIQMSLQASVELPVGYLYLEKSEKLQVAIPNTTKAKAIAVRDGVLIHVTGEESSGFCRLPAECRCAVQHTLQLTPRRSIDVFVNKGSQRIFTNNDNGVIVHFITNSVSTSAVCRSPTVANEVSTLTWNTVPSGDVPGQMFMHPKHFTGYISDVEFFSLKGTTYIVIGRFYDPVENRHDLDCVVLKLNRDKTAAKLIQTIPLAGLWTVSVLYTAQGVTLILGSADDSTQIEGETKILRFNEATEQFAILRTVPLGCSSAVGVVIGLDSLLVLANRRTPLQIFKYDPDFDNYYFYQSLKLDFPVLAVSVFYANGFGISDAYLCVTTQNNNYFIYSYQFIEGWKLVSEGKLNGISSLIVFRLDDDILLFAPSAENSLLLSVVMNDSN